MHKKENPRAIGARVFFLDLTTEYGIPVYKAFIQKGNKVSVSSGYGAHLSGKIAIKRALSELVQVNRAFIETATLNLSLQEGLMPLVTTNQEVEIKDSLITDSEVKIQTIIEINSKKVSVSI